MASALPISPRACMRSTRLPVGLQIMGPYLEDATPIDIARLMADVRDGFEAPPGYA